MSLSFTVKLMSTRMSDFLLLVIGLGQGRTLQVRVRGSDEGSDGQGAPLLSAGTVGQILVLCPVIFYCISKEGTSIESQGG